MSLGLKKNGICCCLLEILNKCVDYPLTFRFKLKGKITYSAVPL